jgi:pimeloyl-ACP methyl ester carboxylesterase
MLEMWNAVGRIDVPTLLILGDRSPAVSVDDIEEWRQRQPDVRVITVKDAGHAVQSDQPAALAHLLRQWLEVPKSRHVG